MRGLSLGCCFALGLSVWCAARPAPLAADATVRAHADDGERLNERGLWERITAWMNDVNAAPAAEASAEPALYRYRGPNGQLVYTNIAQSVPAAQRAGARVDLTAVSLNSELGSDLDRQLARQHRALQTSEVCAAARAAVEQPLWQRLWHEGAPLVVCAGALLLAVLLTPWMLRKGWGASWAKVLSTATPVLGFVGVAAVLLLQSQRSMSNARLSAQRCEPNALVEAPGLKERMQLVQALQAEQRALEQIHAESR